MSLRVAPSVAIRGIRKSFGRVRALDGVDLEIAPGESLVLLGPNGSGKTTLLRAIAGLVRPDAGEISILGVDALRRGPRARRSLAYCPQRPSFPEWLGVAEVVDFYRRLRRLPAGRTAAVLEEVGLAPHASSLARDLSGGMAQRLALAVTLLPESPILLFDEPTASLDPAGVLFFRETAARLRDAGRTLLLTTHILGDAVACADRVAVLVDGRPAAIEPIAEFEKRGRGRSLEEVYLEFGPPPHHPAAARRSPAS